GVPDPARMLTPLLSASLDNALRLGDAGLTGPVARADADTVAAHLTALRASAPEARRAAAARRARGSPAVIPVLASTRLGLAAARRPLGSPVVLVPTMGALHTGHRALLRRAAELATPGGSVLVSIFVNPLQFGAGEDFGRYPRTLDADVAMCGEEGVSVVFAPGHSQMYPREQQITVDPGPVGRILEGEFRPGFFTG